MDPFTLWLTGTGASVAVVIAAVVTFANYSYLRGRLNPAVKMKGLEERLFQIETDYAEQKQEYDDLIRRKLDADQELQKINTEIGDGRRWLEEHRDELAARPEKRREAEEVKRQLAEVKDALREVNAQRLAEEEKVAAAKRELEATHSERERLDEQKTSLGQEVHALEKQRNALEDRIRELNFEQETASANLNLVKSAIENARAELKQAREARERVEDEKRAAERDRDATQAEADALREQISERKARLDAAEASLKSTAKEVDELEKKQRKLEYDVSKLQAEHERAFERLTALQSQLAEVASRLRQEQEALRKAEEDRRAAVRDRENVRSEVETLERQIGHKKAELEVIGKSLEALTKQIEITKRGPVRDVPVDEKLEDFMRPVLDLDAVGEEPRNVEGEQEAFESLCKRISEAGFTYPERALLAFHTSLKTADISPLVVLAGVSGTGKSQLPRLYAQAMGMHFKNVAVQPRWDSPQDMFGFFNYMENRYKATELGRALRQMDFRNWEEQRDDLQKVQEGMLLVLLDEMNLARIEYYFSELLSRLEMRNSVGAGTKEALSLSSVPLELGSLLKNEHPKQLYVGNNVLFVGTMNEDETTQALSPKVMDRANVLRFGKPEKTSGNRTDDRTSGPEPRGYLQYEDWRDWLKTELDHNGKRRLEEVCSRLNKVLQSIHRPFGHRVHQAMESYIANYPVWIGGAFEKALADQLEQKVIPKLRGISQDTDEHAGDVYEEVKSVIKGLNDDELLEAFEAACEEPVFEWHGVNRT